MLALAALVMPASAGATTINVEANADGFSNDGICTLREAVQAANVDGVGQVEAGCEIGSGPDTVQIPMSVNPFTLTTPIDGTPDIDDGDLEVTDADGLTVQGAGTSDTIIDGGDNDRIFDVALSAGVGGLTLNSLTVRNGSVSTDGGGGITSAAKLNLNDVRVTDNETTATSTTGGGVRLFTNVNSTFTDSSIDNNHAEVAGASFTSGGGGISMFGDGALTLSGTEVSDNVTDGGGGGISKLLGTGFLAVTEDSAVDSNEAVSVGGGIHGNSGGALSIVQSSVSDNTLTESVGGSASGSAVNFLTDASVVLQLSTFSGNNATGDSVGPALLLSADTLVNISFTTISSNTATGQDNANVNSIGPAGINLTTTGANDTFIVNSTISGNAVVGADPQDSIFGAGIRFHGPVELSGVTVSGNTMPGQANIRQGGGIAAATPAGEFRAINSTFSGNSAGSGFGGAMQFSAMGANDVTLIESTVADNDGSEAIDYSGTGDVMLRGNIFDEAAGGCVVGGGGALIADSYNVDGGTSCVGVTDDTDLESTDAQLAPLADNGGQILTTLTRELQGPAQVINAVPASDCLDFNDDLLTVDQRGAPRPEYPNGTNCDPGAYERSECLGQPVNRIGTAGTDTIVGTTGNDTIIGLDSADTILADDGDDRICADEGNDQVTGGLGSDTMEGGTGDDTLTGGDPVTGGGVNVGDRVIYSQAPGPVSLDLTLSGPQNTGEGMDTVTGVENVTGSAFDDSFRGPNGTVNNAFNGGAGSDTITFDPAGAAVQVDLQNTSASGQGNDSVIDMENIVATNAVDTLAGNGSDNTITGLLGGELIEPGGGNDTVVYLQQIDANLATGMAIGAEGPDELDTDVENITGSPAGDTLTGSAAANILTGGAGGDTITAGAGADTLLGQAGIDTLFAMDGLADTTVDCGSEVDSFSADTGLDTPIGCETNLNATPPGMTPTNPPGTNPGTSPAPPAKCKKKKKKRAAPAAKCKKKKRR